MVKGREELRLSSITLYLPQTCQEKTAFQYCIPSSSLLRWFKQLSINFFQYLPTASNTGLTCDFVSDLAKERSTQSSEVLMIYSPHFIILNSLMEK